VHPVQSVQPDAKQQSVCDDVACLQIDYKGRRVTAEVMKYDSLRAMHEVMWRSLTSDRSHSAWIDFCRDVVYGEV
jgi:hypothetical protein